MTAQDGADRKLPVFYRLNFLDQKEKRQAGVIRRSMRPMAHAQTRAKIAPGSLAVPPTGRCR
jgi:hypothetical protein